MKINCIFENIIVFYVKINNKRRIKTYMFEGSITRKMKFNFFNIFKKAKVEPISKNAPVSFINSLPPSSIRDTSPLFLTLESNNQYLAAYNSIAPIAAIAEKYSTYLSPIKVYLYKTDKNGELKTNEKNHFILDYFNNLNGITLTQFFEEITLRYILFGNAIIEKPTKLKPYFSIIKNENTVVTNADANKDNFTLSYYYEGKTIKYKKEDLIIIRTPSVGSFNSYFGNSYLKSLRFALSNYSYVGESRNVLAQYPGAMYLLTPKKGDSGFVIPFSVEEKKAINESFFNHSGLSFGRERMELINSEVEVHNLSNDKKDDSLQAVQRASVLEFCQRLSIDPIVVGYSQDSKYSNMENAINHFFVNSCLPIMKKYEDTFNQFFKTADYSIKLVFEVDLPPLSTSDLVQRAEISERMVTGLVSINAAVTAGHLSKETAAVIIADTYDVGIEKAKSYLK